MRSIFAVLMLLAACGGPVDGPRPHPLPYPEPLPPEPSMWCGDGICSPEYGEDSWWCSDCGYDPLTGGPSDGGWCGDGVCFGYEDEWSCCSDCCPESFDPYRDPDPGYIDPVPDRLPETR